MEQKQNAARLGPGGEVGVEATGRVPHCYQYSTSATTRQQREPLLRPPRQRHKAPPTETWALTCRRCGATMRPEVPERAGEAGWNFGWCPSCQEMLIGDWERRPAAEPPPVPAPAPKPTPAPPPPTAPRPGGNGHGLEPPAWLLELPHPADEISVFCPAPSVKLGQNRNAGQETKLRFRTAKEIAETTPANVPWVARPWVVQGAITELDGKIKAAGKTTFLLHLVRAVLDGRPFLGQATAKTHVVFLTEQNDTSFREALEKAGLLGRDDLHVLAWSDAIGIPWHDIMALAVEECHRVGAKLLIVDTLGQWAGLRGDSENNAGDALEAIEPVQRAAASGLAVIVSRHERKSGGEVGDSARGSSAFGGAVDIILSLRRAEGNASDNVRVLHALSRFSETPATLTVELTEDGYVAAVALRKAQEAILDVAPATEEDAMTLEELRKAAGCGRHIAIDAIGALLAEGTLTRVGAGKRGDPYRYYLTPEPGGRDAVPGGEKQETGPQCQKGGGFVSVPTTSLGAGQKTESAGPPTDLPSTCAYCGEVVWTYYGDEGLPLCERHAKAMGAEVT